MFGLCWFSPLDLIFLLFCCPLGSDGRSVFEPVFTFARRTRARRRSERVSLCLHALTVRSQDRGRRLVRQPEADV